MPLIIYFIISFCTLFSHDYHFGLTEIYYNQENKSLETSIKLFTDDLSEALSNKNSFKVNLNNAEEVENSNDLIEEYLTQNLSFEINNKEYTYKYLGKEYEDDVVWLYIEVNKIKKIKDFEFQNTLLFDTFDDQKHITNVNLDGKYKSETLEDGFSTYKIKL